MESICCEIRQAVGRTGLVREEGRDLTSHQWSLQDFQLGQPLAQGCSAVVISARTRNSEEEDTFPLAIKMMFNYHAESNALTILRAMQVMLTVLPHSLTAGFRGRQSQHSPSTSQPWCLTCTPDCPLTWSSCPLTPT